MPTLNIGGKRITVGDEFMSLTPEQQQATVDEIAGSLGAKSKGHDGQEFDPGIPGYDPKTGMVARTGAADKFGAFATAGVEGIPVAGPVLEKGTRAAAAGMVAPFSDQSFGDIYAKMGHRGEQVRQENPKTTLAGNVTGAALGTMPMIAAAPGAFGLTQASKLGRIAGAMTGGAGVGAADAGVRSGGDIDQMRQGLLWGGGLGVGGAVVGPVVGRGVSAVASKLRNSRLAKQLGVDPRAFALMSEYIGADDLANSAKMIDDLGPDAMLMDAGPNARGVAAGVYAQPGPGRTVIDKAVKARDKDANWRIRAALDGTLGPAPVPSEIVDGIARNQQKLQPAYRDVFREAQPAKTGGIALYLDTEIKTLRGEAQKGVRDIRNMLNKVGTEELETNPAVILEIRKAIDGKLETVVDSNAKNALQTARQAIDDQLRESVPRIKEPDAQFAELARQKEAVQRGQTTLASGREGPRPTELAKEVREGALPQGLMVGPSAVPHRLRQGARAEIERLVGTKINDRVALKDIVKGDGDWNRPRLATVFGKDKANEVIDLLDRESAFAETSNTVTKNSETAARNATIKALYGSADDGMGAVDGFVAGGASGAVRGAAVKSAKRLMRALEGKKGERLQEQLANVVTGRGGPVLDALMTANGPSPISQSEIDRVARALLISSSLGN